MTNWHAVTIEETHLKSGSPESGLSVQEAAERLARFGRNELVQKGRKSVWRMLLDQFKDFMVLVLVAAAVVSFVLGETVDAIIILALVVLNAVLGVVQEGKAEQSLDALKKLSAPNAKVLRGGSQLTIPAVELVVGDLVVLETGDYVPADLRLVEFKSLKVQESALTGESVPVDKTNIVLQDDCALGDRINMAFSSSLVTYGRGKGIVVETGMNTQVGKITQMIQSVPPTETPMQKRLNALGKTLGLAALGICGLIFVVGTLYGKDVLTMFMTSVSLAVAAIPEGLPAIATIVLAMGVQRMVKRNAIIRTLPSVETLGSATVICSDKTGTLTQNKMTVMRFASADDDAPLDIEHLTNEDIILAAALCNDAKITGEGAIGDPTETALIEMAAKLGHIKEQLELRLPRVAEVPFDSERKLMTTVHMGEDGHIAYTKGGLDEVLARSTHIKKNGLVREITEEDKEKLRAVNESMASNALRVLAFAMRPADQINEPHKLESGLCYVGMTGMIDPPRPEAKEAVRKCFAAGITPVMITGDHLLTASAIAKELGILHDDGKSVTGAQLEAMSDERLFDEVEHISVYARVSPEHKMRIIDAWQKHGHVVAMTGDGVNDAPALKRADIGAAMGKVGTDVAKEAADVVLTDDNFATVVAAVEEGRRIYDNILKAVSFLLSCNVGEIITLFVATMLNWHEPLLPIHILFINLVTDGLPALALGVDPAVPGIMERQARKQQRIFTGDMIWRMSYQGVMVGVLTLAAFILGSRVNVETGRTMAFATLALSQLFHSFNIRSHTRSIFVVHPFQNLKLVAASALSALLVLITLNVPVVSSIFKLVPLGMPNMVEVALLAVAPILLVEIMKAFKLNGRE